MIPSLRSPRLGLVVPLALLTNPYEGVTAQYATHYLGDASIEELVERPQDHQFKAAMLKRMQRDKVFEEFRSRLNRGVARAED